MSKRTKWILFSIAGLVLLVLIVRAATKKDPGTSVTAEEVKARTLVETVSASGKLYPETEVRISSPIAGEVTVLNVQEGDTVAKGQVLARIQGDRGGSAAPQRISVPNVPPGFENLLQGMQQPRSSGASSATVTAPMSGTVLGLSAKKGERVMGSEMMRIADMENLEVRVDVNENNIIKVSVGDSADVEVEAYNKRKFRGVVTTIVNGRSRTDAQSILSNEATAYEVHIKLDRSSYADLYDSTKRTRLPFRPGMNARADIKTKKVENVLSVPIGAVVSKPKDEDSSGTASAKVETTDEKREALGADDELEEVVFVVTAEGKASRRAVTTGVQDLRHFEIRSGLKAGERVITAPYTAVSSTLRSGDKVTVVTRDKLLEKK